VNEGTFSMSDDSTIYFQGNASVITANPITYTQVTLEPNAAVDLGFQAKIAKALKFKENSRILNSPIYSQNSQLIYDQDHQVLSPGLEWNSAEYVSFHFFSSFQ
jgi:hypothetical protein